jgi:hypothetical protein
MFKHLYLSGYREDFPNDNYDPSDQLLYIENMVKKFRKEEDDEENKMRGIEEDIEKYKNENSELLRHLEVVNEKLEKGEVLEENEICRTEKDAKNYENGCDEVFALEAEWNFLGNIFLHHDALRANMQISLLAPAIESVYRRSLYVLVEEKLGKNRLKDFFGKNGGFEGGAVNRIMQALDELKIESNFDPDIKDYLSALFDYRNALFHNGLEWDEEKCKKFIKKNHRESWFTRLGCSGKTYFILPTRGFIDDLIEFFSGSVESFIRARRIIK